MIVNEFLPESVTVLTIGGLTIDDSPEDIITPIGDTSHYGAIRITDSNTGERFLLQVHYDSVAVLIAALEAEESRLKERVSQ